jgi:hypothetical protein
MKQITKLIEMNFHRIHPSVIAYVENQITNGITDISYLFYLMTNVRKLDELKKYDSKEVLNMIYDHCIEWKRYMFIKKIRCDKQMLMVNGYNQRYLSQKILPSANDIRIGQITPDTYWVIVKEDTQVEYWFNHISEWLNELETFDIKYEVKNHILLGQQYFTIKVLPYWDSTNGGLLEHITYGENFTRMFDEGKIYPVLNTNKETVYMLYSYVLNSNDEFKYIPKMFKLLTGMSYIKSEDEEEQMELREIEDIMVYLNLKVSESYNPSNSYYHLLKNKVL